MLSNLHAIDRSGISGCIIANLCGLLIQAIDRRLLPIRFRLQIGNIPFVCLRLRHGRIDLRQCGVHGAIADLPSHLQRTCVHGSTGNRGSTDGSHTGQLHTVIRELGGLLLQSCDVAFIRGDTVSSGHQITLICFSSKLGIHLILQVIYVFHQSVGSITNLGFKSCYFPLYAPYASIQCCNRTRIRLVFHICRHNILDFIFPVSSQIAQVSICLVVKRCFDYRFIHFVIHSIFKISQRFICSIRGNSNFFTQFIGVQPLDVFFIRSDVLCILNNLGLIGFQSQFSICLRLGIDLICRINFF